MILLQSTKSFDLRTLLLGEENWNFLPEIMFRSAVMFTVTIIALRLIGRRGIMQGVFELVTIITLGSAAGDPMFYKKVGLLPAILVFVMIVVMYKIINYFSSRNKSIEHLIEGRYARLIQEGRILTNNFKHEEISKDEILSDLRLKGVSHLGQVEAAYIEASGDMSVFFFANEDTRYGLPIRPEKYERQQEKISKTGYWSCGYCGNTEELIAADRHVCTVCTNTKWVESVNNKRIE
jgi:uncharacterized membrane protein YcaP (DUF421 family)